MAYSEFDEANARKLESVLPGMPYEDRLKVARIVLSEYGKVSAMNPVPPVYREIVRTRISKHLRMLASGADGELWAAQALCVYQCKVCHDGLADRYEPGLHRQVCGVTDLSSALSSPADKLVFHRALQVQHYGGSWSLNVYKSKCGLTGLTGGSRGSEPCSACFDWW